MGTFNGIRRRVAEALNKTKQSPVPSVTSFESAVSGMPANQAAPKAPSPSQMPNKRPPAKKLARELPPTSKIEENRIDALEQLNKLPESARAALPGWVDGVMARELKQGDHEGLRKQTFDAVGFVRRAAKASRPSPKQMPNKRSVPHKGLTTSVKAALEAKMADAIGEASTSVGKRSPRHGQNGYGVDHTMTPEQEAQAEEARRAKEQYKRYSPAVRPAKPKKGEKPENADKSEKASKK